MSNCTQQEFETCERVKILLVPRFFISVEVHTPKQVNTMENKTKFDVEIADASGHSIVQMTQNEIAQKAGQPRALGVRERPTCHAADIADMNLDAGTRIRLMPAFGGQDAPTFVVEIADKTASEAS